MKKYFGVPIEFDRNQFETKVEQTSLQSKGYCCFVDSYVLVTARRKENGLIHVLENALVNACDGSYIAMFASRLYDQKFVAYNGPEFFTKYIYATDRQCVIGNTPEVFEKVKSRLIGEGYSCDNILYISMPFEKVENYNYEEVARQVNEFGPRYLWVSLGAPKQEYFMHRLLPHINRGVMLGIGAALNYFSGEIRNIPRWATRIHLIWMYRIFTEPAKQMKRSVFILRHYFELYLAERKSVKKHRRGKG